MEGAGAISIDLHKNDPQLTALYQSGLTTLVLENYDENSDTCTFQLAKSPVSATGDNLVIGRSAAVKPGNTLFPMNRWVKIYRNRKFFSLRQIDDTCSSCESDNHIDIYVDSKVRDLPAGKYSAELMPAGFYLH